MISAQSLHGAETSYCSLRNAGLSTTGNHNISITTLKNAERITNVVCTSSTGGNNAAAWALQAKSNRNMTCSHVTNHHWNKERTDFARSLIKQLLILAMHGFNTTNTTTYEGTDTVAILSLKIKLCILNSHLCCSNCKLGIAVNTLSLFLVHVISRIKILYLAGNLGFVLRCIKTSNFINSVFAFQQGIPKNILASTNWADYAKAGNYNAIRQN